MLPKHHHYHHYRNLITRGPHSPCVASVPSTMKLNIRKQPEQATVTATKDVDATEPSSDAASARSLDQAAFLEDRGYIVGGKYASDVDPEYKDKTVTIDADLPLTVTIPTHQNGNNYTVIDFVEGDPQNPYNWNPARKAFTVIMLCGMTLFIGA